MARRSEFVDPELNRENTTPPRSFLAPPAGTIGGVRAIFWNERELRAGWRLVLFSMLFAMFLTAGNRAVALFQLPHATSGNVTAVGVLILESITVAASLCAAAIMAPPGGSPFGAFGVPGAGAFAR